MKKIFGSVAAKTLFVATATFWLISCQQNTDLKPSSSSGTESTSSLKVGNTEVAVKQGRLVFANQADLDAAVRSIDHDKLTFQAVLKAHPSFHSLKLKLEAIDQAFTKASTQTEQEALRKEKEALIEVEDPSLGYLVNKDGYIQVGANVYRITAQNKVLEATETNIGLLADVKSSSPEVKIHDVQIREVSKIEVIPSDKNKGARLRDNIEPINGDHRMIWGYKQENYGFYSTAVILTQCQYYQTYVFKANEWLISNDASVSFNLSYARIYYWIGGEENWIEHRNIAQSGMGSTFFRMGQAGGLGAVTQVAECHASHSLTWNGITKNFSY